ncbi:MAG TPA: hypothetical protein VFY10_02020 [Dehalococcoidia bacterium]|nr:hypothetical protein [Dehalococcoidia bacterium]
MSDFATYSRRAFLGGIGKAALVGGFAGAGLLGEASRAFAAVPSTAQTPANQPLVWVWKFSADGALDAIKQTLQSNGLGIILKTHDGNEWMTRFDKSPDAVVSPQQVTKLANTFEQAGIPFHAWCVVQGIDPIAEAQMCAQVLDAGARSIYLDLEPEQDGNYWRGPWDNANRFGEELRRLQPNAWVTTAPDSRPWQGPAVPLAEFASFSNAIAPQAYWATFKGPANERHFAENGYTIGPDGVTPELMAEVCKRTFAPFNLPVQPIGQGAADGAMWQRFVDALDSQGMQPVSLWRYGTADPGAYPVLKQISSRSAPLASADVAQQAPQTPPQQATQQQAQAPQTSQQQPASSAQAASPGETQLYGPISPDQHITPPGYTASTYNAPSSNTPGVETSQSALMVGGDARSSSNSRAGSAANSSAALRNINGSGSNPLLRKMSRHEAQKPRATQLASILSKIIGR